MKLAIVTETFPPEINGVAMTFGTLARELGRRGHQVTIYRPRRDDLPPAAEHPEYTPIAMPGMAIPRYPQLRIGFPAARRLEKLWREQRPDLVHVVTEGPLGNSAITAALRLRLPVTSSFHTNFHSYTGSYGLPIFRKLALAWLRRVHNRTLITFAPTEELVRELETLGFRNLAILSRGVDLGLFSPARRDDELRAKWGAQPDDVVVLHVGRLAAEKNYPLLFESFSAIHRAVPAVKFVIVGDGPLRARLQSENPHCHFTGFIPREQLATHYASADIYLHPSLTETFGNVLTEAMASGLAVAGFNYAAAKKFIQHEHNGLVAPCDEPQQLIDAGLRLATDANLRRRIRTAAPVSLAAHSWAHIVARFEHDLATAAFTPQP